jgi:hypothetical protein
MMERQVATSQATESELRRTLAQEEGLRQSLQQQLDTLRRDRDLGTQRGELMVNLFFNHFWRVK